MQWTRAVVLTSITGLALAGSALVADPITIAPTTDYLNTASSQINGVTYYGVDFIPTTNVDHTIALLAGGTLNAVGDSITLPIQLTSMELSRLPYGSNYGTNYITATGSEPDGSITLDYTRNNEGGTFTATLPVVLVPAAGGAPVVSDTLMLSGDWSIVGVGQYPGYLVAPTGFYIGDLDGKRVPIPEVGTEMNDVAYLAGPEPGTIGLFGAALLPALFIYFKARRPKLH